MWRPLKVQPAQNAPLRGIGVIVLDEGLAGTQSLAPVVAVNLGKEAPLVAMPGWRDQQYVREANRSTFMKSRAWRRL